MKKKKDIIAATLLLAAFLLWTAAVRIIDVQTIGPQGSAVGFASVNDFVRGLTGVHMALYDLTDLLSLIPAGFMAGFALLGLVQWIRRKSLLKVDRSILALGGVYVAAAAAFVFFELFPVNYRPVLIEGVLEASYPSSTTMLALCVLPTAVMQLRSRIKDRPLRCCVTWLGTAFTIFMVAGRLISGVHWFTDIVGGALYSAGIILLYRAFAESD